ncbi:MAG: hypothetical protein IJB69_04875 [Clostridia bacterium]|nr:hypothetical protein [Clostridia bacterium]
MARKNNKQPGGIKEFFRKMMVSLKRKPQMIPMLVLGAAFLYYSLNLTHISDTTAKIQLGGMGLSGFCTMLFSLLSFVCFMNAYPHRKKTNIPMLVLMFVMLGLLVYCDTHYLSCITRALTRADNPISLTGSTAYVGKAQNVLNVHRIIIAVGAVLTLLVPVLRKLLRKVNTSLDVEENGNMEEIILSED